MWGIVPKLRANQVADKVRRHHNKGACWSAELEDELTECERENRRGGRRL